MVNFGYMYTVNRWELGIVLFSNYDHGQWLPYPKSMQPNRVYNGFVEVNYSFKVELPNSLLRAPVEFEPTALIKCTTLINLPALAYAIYQSFDTILQHSSILRFEPKPFPWFMKKDSPWSMITFQFGSYSLKMVPTLSVYSVWSIR